MPKNVKIIVFTPIGSTDKIREAMANAGAGQIGNYSHTSFSSSGIGRFKPLKNAKPAIGQIDKLEEVEEERIEVICTYDKARDVIQAIKSVHPYEEPAIDTYTLENI
ncbi:hypothetical protein KKH39_03860 [Patescibacteria group bacterium]|nr:hypothetical protein [Patescibacteria group bacterium]